LSKSTGSSNCLVLVQDSYDLLLTAKTFWYNSGILFFKYSVKIDLQLLCRVLLHATILSQHFVILQ